MGRISDDDLRELREAVDLARVFHELGFKVLREGDEHVVSCPFHPERTPSCRVYPNRPGDPSHYHCYGCGAHGDAIKLLTDHQQLAFQAAVDELRRISGLPLLESEWPEYKKPAAKRTWEPILPVPLKVEQLGVRIRHFQYGEPVAVYRYLDSDGRLLGVTARFDRPAKPDEPIWEVTYQPQPGRPDSPGIAIWKARAKVRKEVVPYTWCWAMAERDGKEVREERWQQRSFPKPRPLFGLDLLAKYPDDEVFIVEGEKTCLAARQLHRCSITWPGGGKAVSKADWSVLKGRTCVICPDADDEGRQAAAEVVRQLLHGSAAEVRVVDLREQILPLIEDPWTMTDPNEDGAQSDIVSRLPKGWDLADA